MRKLFREIIEGIVLALCYTIVTIALVESSEPHKYLSFYLGFELISFILFSTYGAVLIATVSTFIALGTLLITENWFALSHIAVYWISILVMNFYLEDMTNEYGRQILEIENLEKKMSVLSNDVKENNVFVEFLAEKINRYEKLSELSLWLSTTLNMEKIYNRVLDFCRELFHKEEVQLRNKADDQYDRWVIEHKRPLIVKHSGKDYRFTKSAGGKFNSIIECPIFHDHDTPSLLRITGSEQDFTPSDLRLLNVITTLTTIALEKGRLFRKTNELAIKDSLTGLYTHIYFKERLEEEVKRAARYRESFVVMMIDIDDFKHFNDTYGHQSGDEVLHKVSETIQKIVRETDIVGRYGGEEISVLLYNINIKSAKDLAERIRKSVSDHEYVFDNNKAGVTLTIGMASFPKNPTQEELVRRADEELYKGKKEGKNRVKYS